MPILPLGAIQAAPATPCAASPATPSAKQPSAPAATAPILNPDPVIDPGLGIVVLQYFSNQGTETHSVPSRQVLDQYQLYGLETPSQKPTPTPTATGPGAYA